MARSLGSMRTGSMVFRDRQFAPLMWTQFFGALNDNILKNALIVLLAFKGIELWGLQSESLISLATLIFILPFFLFSALAGQISDKFEKARIIRAVKLVEIGIMVLAGGGFYFALYPVLLGVLFLMGLHSTFFGPVKYSSLPELLPTEKLTKGNAYIEVGTFIAILLGTIGGGYLVALENGEFYVIGFLIFNSLIGYALSRLVPTMKIGDQSLKIQLNPIPPTIETIKISARNKTVFNSILGISWFWFLGAVILSLLPTITRQVINGNEHVVSVFLAIFTIGIAAGAVLCERLSFERPEIGLVPFGSFGMTIFLVDMASVLSGWSTPLSAVSPTEMIAAPGAIHLLIDLFGVAISGGVFTVPLYTLIQQRSERESRSRIIGANNIINALFMVVGSGVLMVLLQAKFKLPSIIILYAILNLFVSGYIYSLVPEFALRFLAWILTRCLYRLRTRGTENVPAEGAAILVCNHVSFIDWLIISAAIKRPTRFVMYYKFAGFSLFRYFMLQAGVIPIAGKTENPEIFKKAFEEISSSLKAGDLVSVFPEGMLTPDGEIHEFKKGIEFILAKDPVPVVPMALNGLWGSFFSHFEKRAPTKLPRRLWYRVELAVGEAIPPEKATAALLETKVRELALKRN